MASRKNTQLQSEEWFGTMLAPGERATLSVVITQSYAGNNISIPVHVWRGEKRGPTVAVTAAVHGDEINGTGAIRRIIREQPFDVVAGTLVLVPVVNILGFEHCERYLPDRRDLNRSFPGSTGGSLASRMAASFFKQVIKRCNYCIDLHTAALRRTNFPNVRADMSDPKLAEFARAFGAELIVESKGPKGSLRASACKIGCHTLILEAGEVWKVEPTVVEYAVRGITNCLQFLKMIDGTLDEPEYRVETNTTTWVRAKQGGFLEFHVAPGDIVDKDAPIATNTDLVGMQRNVVTAPRDGIVLGMTTIPSVAPGDPICHLAFPRTGTLHKISGVHASLSAKTLHERVRGDLARSMLITQADPQSL
ncbi:MAG: succinylglutamate desuccinylase/aspartoacylase family protein [Phycisphaeraceae bacterium]|nr:succinylglutamate desuccinylase/aspartoacylase family protein [Phycisphaerales bacterium]MCB9859493.1 succinylglutamate desuccinylase/aspartoacylase family protein [Phycisphaeraceae bacterium]